MSKCLICGKDHEPGPVRYENGVPICSEMSVTRPSTLARVLARAPEYEQLSEQGVLDEVASRRSGVDIGALRGEEPLHLPPTRAEWEATQAEIAALKAKLAEAEKRTNLHDLRCKAAQEALAEAEAVIQGVSEMKAGGCGGCTEAAAVGSDYCRACSYGRGQVLCDSYLARHGKGGK